MGLRDVGPGHYYAGIGSRETPPSVMALMTRMARSLAAHGWVLRSGGAAGADLAFERGAHDKKQIWLPWLGFNGNPSRLTATRAAYEMAEKYHPNWPACSKTARDMHARNCHQVLGADLATPVKFVACWTKDGLGGGGTGQAIRIARAHGITVYDLAIVGTSDLLKRFVS